MLFSVSNQHSCQNWHTTLISAQQCAHVCLFELCWTRGQRPVWLGKPHSAQIRPSIIAGLKLKISSVGHQIFFSLVAKKSKKKHIPDPAVLKFTEIHHLLINITAIKGCYIPPLRTRTKEHVQQSLSISDQETEGGKTQSSGILYVNSGRKLCTKYFLTMKEIPSQPSSNPTKNSCKMGPGVINCKMQ